MTGGELALALALIFAQAPETEVGRAPAVAQNPRPPQFRNPARGVVQPIPRPDLVEGNPEEGPEGHKLFPSERSVSQLLLRAQQSLQAKNFGQALTALQFLIDQPGDYFVETDDETAPPQSIKAQAEQLLATLPDEARRQYELEYGLTARQMLDSAIADRDPAALREVVRRYFHTQAGYEAAYRLGGLYLDQSQPLAAAALLDRLRQVPQASRAREPLLSLKAAIAWSRAGMPDRSREILLAIQAAGPLVLQGKKLPPYQPDSDLAAWLAQALGQSPDLNGADLPHWPMVGGDGSRNASAEPATPVWDGQWRADTLAADPALLPGIAGSVRDELAAVEQEFRDAELLTFPAPRPLIVGNRVIFRALTNVRAVDLQTGKPLWETALHDAAYVRLAEEAELPAERGDAARTPSQTLLAQRAWRDVTYGSLTSDSERVYTLEELGYAGTLMRTTVGGAAGLSVPADSNKLTAFRLETGKFLWEVGGPRGDYALDLAGTFFLGPPLPQDGKLYCVAETGGEIRLLVLNAADGSLEWSQSLLLAQTSLAQFPLRRLSGVSPSAVGGIVICPTTAGAVVAVDLSRRALLWGYRYPANNLPGLVNQQPGRLATVTGNAFTRNDDQDRWVDSNPIIAAGCVLVTPRDSDELHCLNVLDGVLRWKCPRGQDLYVAAAYEGNAILVGRAQVRALRLADGSEAWTHPAPIPHPAGQGIRSGRFYHVPVEGGEICTIDLADGKILARSPSRSNAIYGNLVAAGGTIVSQSVSEVSAFRPLAEIEQDLAARLAQSPDDADALALRGELLLHRGQEAAALNDLRRATAGSHDARAQNLIVETLLEGLRLDYDGYRASAAEIDQLAPDTQQLARYLRLSAERMIERGERDAAFDALLRLSQLDVEPELIAQAGGAYFVDSRRWVRPRIEQLYQAADAEARARMDNAIQAHLEAALAAPDTGALERIVESFFALPVADRARKALAERWDGKSPLALEMLLERLRQSPDPELAGYATARLAKLLVERKQTSGLRRLVEELEGPAAEVVCLDGKTGAQLAAAWRAEASLAGALADESQWPERHLVATPLSLPPNTRLAGLFFPVELLEPRSASFQNWHLEIDQHRQNLMAYDGRGELQWRFPIQSIGESAPYLLYNNVRTHGHLAVAVFSNRFVTLDTFNAGTAPEILWKGGLQDPLPGHRLGGQVQPPAIPTPTGGFRSRFSDIFERPLGSVGPITDDYLCFQRGARLIAVQPRTGEVLWQRDDVPRGCDLFGDDDFVIAAPPGSPTATIYRAADGAEVGSGAVPPIEERAITDGRRVLAWRTAAERHVIELIDPVADAPVWKRDFHPESAVSLVGSSDVAVMEPSGQCVVMHTADGTVVSNFQIDPLEGLEQLVVRQYGGRYVVLTRTREHAPKDIHTTGISLNDRVVNGYVYGVDAAGGNIVWKTPIDQLAIDLRQPAHLPFLVLMGANTRSFVRGRDFNAGREVGVLVLDVRTGAEIYKPEPAPEQVAVYHVQIQGPQGKFLLTVQRSQVELAFSDTPLGEPAPGPSSEEKPDAKPPEGAGNAP